MRHSLYYLVQLDRRGRKTKFRHVFNETDGVHTLQSEAGEALAKFWPHGAVWKIKVFGDEPTAFDHPKATAVSNEDVLNIIASHLGLMVDAEPADLALAA